MGLSLHRGPVGEPGGGSFDGTSERKVKYIGVPLLDPEDIKILSLRTIWNYSKGTALSRVDITFWGTKGPSIRPRCIGAIRARTQMLINESVNQDLRNKHHYFRTQVATGSSWERRL